MSMELLEPLSRRFGRVSYRYDIEKYEIGGMVLLSTLVASAVIAGERTLEQVVIERNTPAHLRQRAIFACQSSF